jgi:hypothetical protein
VLQILVVLLSGAEFWVLTNIRQINAVGRDELLGKRDGQPRTERGDLQHGLRRKLAVFGKRRQRIL